jgi:hypothetical protein
MRLFAAALLVQGYLSFAPPQNTAYFQGKTAVFSQIQ